ncbi:MAG: hypothetical protein RLZ12_533 [Bacillota bacterium]|jgi:hypothetical protein
MYRHFQASFNPYLWTNSGLIPKEESNPLLQALTRIKDNLLLNPTQARLLNTALTELQQENWNTIRPNSSNEQANLILMDKIASNIDYEHDDDEYVGDQPYVGMLGMTDLQELQWGLENKLKGLINKKSKLALALTNLIEKIKKTFDAMLFGVSTYNEWLMLRKNIYIAKYLYEKIKDIHDPKVQPLAIKLYQLLQKAISNFITLAPDITMVQENIY